MPRAGLADRARQILAAAVTIPAVVARYQARVHAVEGTDCLLWSGEVAGRGRFWLSTTPAVTSSS